MAKMIQIKEKDFIEHVKRICRKNIQKNIKICKVCPLRGDVIRTMRKYGWKIPKKK